LTDAGELGLLVAVEDDRVLLAALPAGQTLLHVSATLAESGDGLSCASAVEGLGDGLGFAVESLPADAALACQSLDVAVASAVDGVGTSNPWYWGYDVHGVTPAGAAFCSTHRVIAAVHPLTVHSLTFHSAYFEIVSELAGMHFASPFSQAVCESKRLRHAPGELANWLAD
jgi:hypothetical protein